MEHITSGSPVLHMASPTHYANLMMRYMVGTKLSKMLPDFRMSSVSMPYWDIQHEFIPAAPGERVCRVVSEQHFAFEQIRYFVETGLYTRFDWHGYGQRMENFPSKAICRALFIADREVGLSTSEDTIVCPVRGAEILNAIHPGYTSVPVEFYSQVIEELKLTPIFMGQTEDNTYVRRLKARFPRAEFLPHMGALADFQTIRKARNIILPVSTFAWLAAWLSEARHIVLPVFGIFNPRLFPNHDLLPVGEGPYRFYQFPDQPAVPLERMEEAHAAIFNQWRETSAGDLIRKDI